ncbi:MAG: hypothetical protein J0L63_10245 [Anaerolineae bacterium]|nr:hypothetical protein [Anaerolineae bacterium]MBN8619277.1 hypothetical protein [Anaerolineae bacterium]
MNWSPYPWWVPGAALVFFGVMIAIFPELLALMVASAFLFSGLSWLVGGWAMRRNRPTQRVHIYTQERWPW